MLLITRFYWQFFCLYLKLIFLSWLFCYNHFALNAWNPLTFPSCWNCICLTRSDTPRTLSDCCCLPCVHTVRYIILVDGAHSKQGFSLWSDARVHFHNSDRSNSMTTVSEVQRDKITSKAFLTFPIKSCTKATCKHALRNVHPAYTW